MSTAKIFKQFLVAIPLMLLIATFVIRVYRLDHIQFDSDFGRDSLFGWRMINEKFTLLGAQASVGGFYLGPLYFYAIAFLFGIFGPIPELIMLGFACLNLCAAWIGFRLFRDKVSYLAGVIFLILFSTQPLLVAASRGATHVPMLPFVTLLTIAVLIKSIEKNRLIWFLASGLCFGLFFHTHFSALLLLPGYMCLVFLCTSGIFLDKFKAILFHGAGMIIMTLPLLLFDIRHDFLTSKAFVDYVSSVVRGGEIRSLFPHWSLSEKIRQLMFYLGSHKTSQTYAVLGGAFGLIMSIRSKFHKTLVFRVISLLALSVVLLLLLYKGYLFSYYLVVPGTVLVVILSLLLSQMKTLGVIIALIISFSNLNYLIHLYRPQFRTTENLSHITSAIETHLNTKARQPFALYKDSSDHLTGLGYEYRFLLVRDGFVPVSEFSYEKASILYVIREEGVSDPVTLGGYEMSKFAPKKAELVSRLRIHDREIDLFALYK